MATQWRLGPAGVVIGLDYSAVDAAIKRLELEVSKEQFRGLQYMEAAAIEAMNKNARV